MTNPWARDRATSFYLGMALAGLIVAATGFSTTYVLPIARSSFSAPWYVHVHGAACLGWLLLVIVQSQHVLAGRTPLHRNLGKAALPLAVTLWAAGIATGHWASARDLPSQGAAAKTAFLGTMTGLTLFLIIVGAAIAWRKRPDWHKRMILLATIHVLWPAFFRLRHLLPDVPRPEIWLAVVVAYSPILVAAIRDRRRYGKVHPVWLFIAPALVAEQSIEFAYFDSAPWRRLGQAAFDLFS